MLISAYMRFRRRFSSTISFISEIKEHPYRQTWRAICRNARCSCHARGKAHRPARRPHSTIVLGPMADKVSLLQHCHDLRVAVSSILHHKSPQISCRENSTFEHRQFWGDYPRAGLRCRKWRAAWCSCRPWCCRSGDQAPFFKDQNCRGTVGLQVGGIDHRRVACRGTSGRRAQGAPSAHPPTRKDQTWSPLAFRTGKHVAGRRSMGPDPKQSEHNDLSWDKEIPAQRQLRRVQRLLIIPRDQITDAYRSASKIKNLFSKASLKAGS